MKTIYWHIYNQPDGCVLELSLCSGYLRDDESDLEYIEDELDKITELYFDGLSENYYGVYFSEADWSADVPATEDEIRSVLSTLPNFEEI